MKFSTLDYITEYKLFCSTTEIWPVIVVVCAHMYRPSRIVIDSCVVKHCIAVLQMLCAIIPVLLYTLQWSYNSILNYNI